MSARSCAGCGAGTASLVEQEREILKAAAALGAPFAVPRGGGAADQIVLPAETLATPGGIAAGGRGDLFVSTHATTAGGGEVLKIELDD